MTAVRVLVVAVLLGTLGRAGAAPDDDADAGEDDAVITAPPGAPPIAQVLAAAYAAAGLDRDASRSWIRRARVAGLIPWLSVRVGRDTSWQDQDPTVDRGATVDVRATWRLDRLLFDGRELQVASIEGARRRERRRLASRVIRAYFAWRRLAGVVSSQRDGDPAAAMEQRRRSARAEEAAAELDALTDGWFSDELARARHPATRPIAGQPGSGR